MEQRKIVGYFKDQATWDNQITYKFTMLYMIKM